MIAWPTFINNADPELLAVRARLLQEYPALDYIDVSRWQSVAYDILSTISLGGPCQATAQVFESWRGYGGEGGLWRGLGLSSTNGVQLRLTDDSAICPEHFQRVAGWLAELSELQVRQ